MVLFYLDAAEGAVAFNIECLEAVGLLGVAGAVDTGEGGFDVVLDADVVVDTYLDAAEAAVEVDDGAVHDVGIAQVEAGKSKASVHIGAFEILATEAVFLFAEVYVNLIVVAAVLYDGLDLVGDVTMAGFLVVAEEQERKAPHNGNKAEHILPDVVPGDDAAGGEEQQYADAAADDGAGLMAVAENIDEAGYDDKERPPAFEADADDVEEFQGPDDAESQQGDAADDFACTFHFFSFIRRGADLEGCSSLVMFC